MNTSSVILLCHLPSHTFLWIKKTGSMVINKSLFLLTVYKEFVSFSSLFSYKIKEERRSMRLFTPMLNEDQSQIHATHLDLFFPSPLIIYFGLICWRSIANQCPAGVILPFTFFFLSIKARVFSLSLALFIQPCILFPNNLFVTWTLIILGSLFIFFLFNMYSPLHQTSPTKLYFRMDPTGYLNPKIGSRDKRELFDLVLFRWA